MTDINKKLPTNEAVTATCVKCGGKVISDPASDRVLTLCDCGGQEYSLSPIASLIPEDLTILTVPVSISASYERLQDLLCTAFEGGSNYWYLITGTTYPKGEDKVSLGIEFEHMELPFHGGSIQIAINDNEAGDDKVYNLDLDAIKSGLQVFHDKETRHYADWLNENDDATTGDVFLQCCLFGEVVYG